jgi:hypothetical protein
MPSNGNTQNVVDWAAIREVIFILEPSEQANAAIGKRVTVVDYPDGRLYMVAIPDSAWRR